MFVTPETMHKKPLKDFYYLHTNWYETKTKTKYVEVRVKTTKNYFWDREQQSSVCGQKLEIEARFFYSLLRINSLVIQTSVSM